MDSLRVFPSFWTTVLSYFMVVYVMSNPTDRKLVLGAVQLTKQNFDMTLASNELVFVNFYADWSRLPRFDDAADKVLTEFPHAGKVVMGKVNCDEEYELAARFRITKYPTLKIFRNGQLAKKEYRGHRFTDSLVDFVKKELEDPIKEFHDLEELIEFGSNKTIVIGYFDRKDQPEYNIFRRVATNVKDDCLFYAGFGEAFKMMHPPEHPVIVFRPDKDSSNETFTGTLLNFNELLTWAADKCVPLVKEMTLENAEELAEEGLASLILFHDPDDKESIKNYTNVVQMDLLSEKQAINFLTANGKKFDFSLHNVDKSEKDLPLIAIAQKHMYLFPNFKDIEIPGKLKEFIQDFYSGKLHREFHYGPDQNRSEL